MAKANRKQHQPGKGVTVHCLKPRRCCRCGAEAKYERELDNHNRYWFYWYCPACGEFSGSEMTRRDAKVRWNNDQRIGAGRSVTGSSLPKIDRDFIWWMRRNGDAAIIPSCFTRCVVRCVKYGLVTRIGDGEILRIVSLTKAGQRIRIKVPLEYR